MNIIQRLFAALPLAAMALAVNAAPRFVSFGGGDVRLCSEGAATRIFVGSDDNVAVRTAATNLAADFGRVCGTAATLSADTAGCRVIAATVGTRMADAIVKAGAVDATQLKGRREKFVITTSGGRLCIIGSDRRGTVYGIYELSRQMGVSPWYWWMDVPVRHQKAVYANGGTYTDGEPAVRYRGIFLNDEAPCLTSWVKNTFGTRYGGHDFYARVFELVLRLRGNFVWPAMWSWAFYADDPLNSKTADDMGVIIGTSHHEPMGRSHKEWHGHSDDPSQEAQDIDSRQKASHEWNYATNKAGLDAFWRGGVERNKATEDLITIGMRGDGDMAMSKDRDVKLLESVIKNQRRIISEVRHRPAKDVPQVWTLYKEVMDYYDDGLRVPDDVTILLCDDNWGNVRRVPTARERQRKGGWGLYYHVDYVGAPRNSKLINATPIQHEWEQLSLAYENGIDRLWILNVGDLKPMEYPIQLFMDMAWNPASADFATDGQGLLPHTRQFCDALFGTEQGTEAARLLNAACKLNGRCTAEMLDAKTYDLASGEWDRVVSEYDRLEIDALRQFATIPAEYRDAYDELLLFPVQLMANLHRMYHAQAVNNALYKKGDAVMDTWADCCAEYFRRDSTLMAHYNHDVAGGKWNGMMTQKHIGYTSWNDSFKRDIMPTVYRSGGTDNTYFDDGRGYIAIEAPHYYAKADAATAKWTELPLTGRTLGAMTLMPRTEPVGGASLTYRFTTDGKASKATVHIVTKTTLDYLNKGGMTYSVSIDGGQPVTVNFNGDLNEAPKNIYDVFYPTVARRVIEKVVELPVSGGGAHTLTFTPNDPDIVLEKLVVDLGGYTPQYLFGRESPRKAANAAKR